ncbi:MAG: DUF3859 domain-containing protein [Leptolyngbyaceae cyanobacterium MO_188.B28]|nr:DUF3859 domain-containing protein [Leptolyngbyaceae cyanobacterium MO_188.B28]
MTKRLTDDELKRLIAEVDRLARSREAELDREQVEDILNELGLPSELLDDALMQLRRQEVAAAQTRRRNQIVAAVCVVVFVGLALTFFGQWRQWQVQSRVGAIQDQLTLADGSPIALINRQEGQEVFYQVTLENAPVGRRLPLACNWFNPSGQIVRQNTYHTQVISTPVWRTHCKHRIGFSADPGDWAVEMYLGKRPLDSQTFKVE